MGKYLPTEIGIFDLTFHSKNESVDSVGFERARPQFDLWDVFSNGKSFMKCQIATISATGINGILIE